METIDEERPAIDIGQLYHLGFTHRGAPVTLGRQNQIFRRSLHRPAQTSHNIDEPQSSHNITENASEINENRRPDEESNTGQSDIPAGETQKRSHDESSPGTEGEGSPDEKRVKLDETTKEEDVPRQEREENNPTKDERTENTESTETNEEKKEDSPNSDHPETSSHAAVSSKSDENADEREPETERDKAVE